MGETTHYSDDNTESVSGEDERYLRKGWTIVDLEDHLDGLEKYILDRIRRSADSGRSVEDLAMVTNVPYKLIYILRGKLLRLIDRGEIYMEDNIYFLRVIDDEPLE